jgi:hypothetical protein
MTGDNEPTVSIVETGLNTLASLQERAKAVRSGLNLAHRPPGLGNWFELLFLHTYRHRWNVMGSRDRTFA